MSWLCPRCGDRLALIAVIQTQAVIARILAHLGLPTALPAGGRRAHRPCRSAPTTILYERRRRGGRRLCEGVPVVTVEVCACDETGASAVTAP
jgi:hypothetical protein